MLFNSYAYLAFFPAVVMVYYILPVRVRYLWLLIASYFFYMCWSVKYSFLLLLSTLITYLSGILIDRIANSDNTGQRKTAGKKICVAVSVILNLSILFFFKYFDFLMVTVNSLLRDFNLQISAPVMNAVLPVGLSFYIFQALSYTIDVYRGDIYVEKNFFRYALFVSFFPQLVAGPIEKSKNLLKQLSSMPEKFSFDRLRSGFLLMLWGYFLKLVIADRAALYINTIFDSYTDYEGWYLIVAVILFGIQIYGDFYGYSTIAAGSAEVFGIKLMNNFDAPYLSRTTGEFWRRWHISLNTWFRDYLYIPLGGNRKGRLRKVINLLVVFLLSGLWHGAKWTFVVWGLLNGIFVVISEYITPLREKVSKKLGLNKDSFGYKLGQVIITFILVDFAWMFFRADDMDAAMKIVPSMFSARNLWILFDGSLYECGLDEKNFTLLAVAIGVVIFADICKYKGISIRRFIISQDYLFRWIFVSLTVVCILLFGIWGSVYDESAFIYFQF